MGSSDPLPAGFEIQFGSLNFQATGNGYLMRITNCEELRARLQAGPAPTPVTPAAGASMPASTDAASPRCLDAADAPVNALDRRGRNAGRLRVPPRSATHSLARRQPPRRGSTRFQDRGSLSACAVPRRHASPPPTPTRQRAGLVLPATSRRSGIPTPPPTTSRPTAPLASCHPPPHTGTWSGTSPAYWTR
jgi:hypothetical protein